MTLVPESRAGQALSLSIVLTGITALVIAALTLMPPPETDLPPGPDKLYHLAAFVFLALPLAIIRPRWNLWMFVLFTAFGAAIEIVQPYVGRSRELADLLADMAGIAIGMVAGLVIRRWSENRRTSG